jgi:tetratricopeptide (TPR) repeat protein
MLVSGAVDEFNFAYLLVGLIPFFFYSRMQRREQAWFQGLAVMYLFLSVLLIVLLNPSSDRQSREMNRVFFTASHVMISLCVAYGLALFGALILANYQRYRVFALYGGAVAVGIAVYTATVIFSTGENLTPPTYDTTLFERLLETLLPKPSHDPLVRFTALFALSLAASAVALFIVARQRAPILALLGIFAIMPAKSALSHWSDNEQRGHLFGFWFGHDMFTPPFAGPDGKLTYDAKLREELLAKPEGKLIYPEMARNAVLFGGTDPGRFCPTYMIFCESFIPPRCRRNPEFDRRDVCLITQNALADGTYLEYIRAHYNRSAQDDKPFFLEMLRTKADAARGTTNEVARLAYKLLDVPLTTFGARVEARRRAQGVYPPVEIHTPTPEDHQQCFGEYMVDVQRRMHSNQLKPGEDVRIDQESGKLQVQGQVAVMAINGLLTKVIFDKNPTNEFYVEESFPLDWMYEYLEPYGIIMKINRQPLPEIPDEMIRRDHEFWSRYSERLIGNWITYDTTVKQICDFVARIHEQRDFTGFKGDPKFIRDDQAQKSFSKLRSSIGGLYSWRVSRAKTAAEQQRMFKEADFAFRQAFAFCPYSPEAVFRYTTLLATFGRLDDAELITETCLRFDRENGSIKSWINQIRAMKQQQGSISKAQQDLRQKEEQIRTNPNDAKLAFDLASLYLQMQRTNAALNLLDQLITNPEVDLNTLLSVAGAYVQLQQGPRLENALKRLVTVSPESPEAWYDLATTQAALGKRNDAVLSLKKALELSAKRLAQEPTARDLRKDAFTNNSFAALRPLPEFQTLVASP